MKCLTINSQTTYHKTAQIAHKRKVNFSGLGEQGQV